MFVCRYLNWFTRIHTCINLLTFLSIKLDSYIYSHFFSSEEAKNMSKSDYTEQSKEHYSHREHSVMTELDINDGGNDRYKTTFLSTATSLSPTSDRQNKVK